MITITAQPGMLGDEGDLPHEVQLLCAYCYKWWGYNGSIMMYMATGKFTFTCKQVLSDKAMRSLLAMTNGRMACNVLAQFNCACFSSYSSLFYFF